MPLTFLNGGAPDYSGENVSNGSQILTNIQTTLIAAGWASVEDNILNGNDANQYSILSCTSIIGSTIVYYRFSIEDNNQNIAGGFRVKIEGSTSSSFTTNVSKAYFLDYIDFNTESKLWLTADEEAFAICIISFGSLSGGVHGGFLNRVEPLTDSGAYCIGYILSNIELKYNGYNNNANANPESAFYQIGLDAHGGRTWHEVLDSFFWTSFANRSASPAIVPVQGFFDRYTVCMSPYFEFKSTTLTNARINAAFMAQNGNLNGVDGKAVLGEYFVTEGRNSISDYATTGQLASQLYYRGSTKFNVVGLASFSAGTQVADTLNRRYLSVGNVGWQGFQIT